MAKLMLRVGSALLILLGLLNLSGCVTDEFVQVPVTEAWRQPLHVPIKYSVQPGDSLYSVAWMYGLDYRQVAQDNHIVSPYHIRRGQKLQLRPQSNSVMVSTDTDTDKVAGAPVAQQPIVPAQAKATSAPTLTTPAAASAQTINQPAMPSKTAITTTPSTTPVSSATTKVAGITWMWPAQGKIVNGFAASGLNRGVDIAGKLNDPVVAAAAGRVVYAGNGLRGYGLLIIIKHNDDYLSAYAHNQKLLVKEGQLVQLGQPIATLGASEAKSPLLHFEIRLNGKPTDPIKYLPSH
jgi:lipoprotein NlpD